MSEHKNLTSPITRMAIEVLESNLIFRPQMEVVENPKYRWWKPWVPFYVLVPKKSTGTIRVRFPSLRL